MELNMKIKQFLMVLLLVGFAATGTEYRNFKSADGKTIRGKVVKYDGKRGAVTIERDTKKRATVPIVVFSREDQEYIKEWQTLEAFRSESVLRVECSDKKIEQWKEDESAFQRKFEKMVYEVQFNNRADTSVGPLNVEYKIFYEQEENDSATKKVVTHQKEKKGKFDPVTLQSKGKQTLVTDNVVLENFEFNMSDYYVPGGDPESTSGEIKGIWVRLRVKMKSGEDVVRDVYAPESIRGKYTW